MVHGPGLIKWKLIKTHTHTQRLFEESHRDSLAFTADCPAHSGAGAVWWRDRDRVLGWGTGAASRSWEGFWVTTSKETGNQDLQQNWILTITYELETGPQAPERNGQASQAHLDWILVRPWPKDQSSLRPGFRPTDTEIIRGGVLSQ